MLPSSTHPMTSDVYYMSAAKALLLTKSSKAVAPTGGFLWELKSKGQVREGNSEAQPAQ